MDLSKAASLAEYASKARSKVSVCDVGVVCVISDNALLGRGPHEDRSRDVTIGTHTDS